MDSYVKYGKLHGLVPVWWRVIILTQWSPDKILTFENLCIQLYSMVRIIYPYMLVPLSHWLK